MAVIARRGANPSRLPRKQGGEMKYIETKTKRYFLCPHCQREEMYVEHLLTEAERDGKNHWFGPLICSKCNHEIKGECTPRGVKIESVYKCKRKQILALLRFRDLYVVIDKYRESDDYDFLFHSHQCPTNIMRSSIEVFDPKYGSDPHGVFRFVSAVEDTEENRGALDKCSKLESLFQLFGTDGSEAPSEWPEKNHGVLPWIVEQQRKVRPES